MIAEYRRTYRLIEAARRLKGRRNGHSTGNEAAKKTSAADPLVARGFAWMFSGARMPAPKLIDFVLDRVVERGKVTTDTEGQLFKERHERRIS